MRIVVLVVALLVPGVASAAVPKPDTVTIETFQRVLDVLSTQHISGMPQSVLIRGAIEGMVASLADPYTEVYTPSGWDGLQEILARTHTGIGVRVTVTPTGARIDRVYAQTSAERAGLRRGMRIVAIDGQPISAATLQTLEGDDVGVERTLRIREEMKTWDVRVAIAPYTVPSIDSVRTDGDIGYVALQAFGPDTGAAFDAVMRQWNGSVRGWVIDVRDNPGGYLEAAKHVVSRIMPQGTLVQTIDRNGVQTPIAVTGGTSLSGRVVVLVNDRSASASEIVAGALQDAQKATIVGTKTFGKGSVQVLVPLPQGGIKITVQQYMTPLGRPVHGVGIAPDVRVAAPLRQLVVALRLAGEQTMRLTYDEERTVVEGIETRQTVPVVIEGGKRFVSALVLCDALEAEVLWDAYEKRIIVTKGMKTRTFGVGTGLLLRNGVSYVAEEQWMRAFPAMKLAAGTMEWSL
ncbi:MAG: hypothetical protein KGO83_00675 [Paenibacillaceae bacterium]|nr:hypothetical protein [Paenibacillaceae bacterium]